MKKVVISLFAVVAFAGTVFAADVIEMKKGVTFTHKAHMALVPDCTKCHATAAGGKIEGFGKDYSHKTCKGCHVDSKKGPTTCKECHKK
jgi:class III cytochrome C family protein